MRSSQDWSSASSKGDRRNAHGRRPPSSLYPPGGVRSFGPAGGASFRSAGQGVPLALHLTLPKKHVGPRGVLFEAIAQGLDEGPQLFQTPGWVKRKRHRRESSPRASGAITQPKRGLLRGGHDSPNGQDSDAGHIVQAMSTACAAEFSSACAGRRLLVTFGAEPTR